MNLSWTGEIVTNWWNEISSILWQSSLVIVIALAAVTWARKSSAPVRYAILMLALVKLLLPSLFLAYSPITGMLARHASPYCLFR